MESTADALWWEVPLVCPDRSLHSGTALTADAGVIWHTPGVLLQSLWVSGTQRWGDWEKVQLSPFLASNLSSCLVGTDFSLAAKMDSFSPILPEHLGKCSFLWMPSCCNNVGRNHTSQTALLSGWRMSPCSSANQEAGGVTLLLCLCSREKGGGEIPRRLWQAFCPFIACENTVFAAHLLHTPPTKEPLVLQRQKKHAPVTSFDYTCGKKLVNMHKITDSSHLHKNLAEEPPTN